MSFYLSPFFHRALMRGPYLPRTQEKNLLGNSLRLKGSSRRLPPECSDGKEQVRLGVCRTAIAWLSPAQPVRLIRRYFIKGMDPYVVLRTPLDDEWDYGSLRRYAPEDDEWTTIITNKYPKIWFTKPKLTTGRLVNSFKIKKDTFSFDRHPEEPPESFQSKWIATKDPGHPKILFTEPKNVSSVLLFIREIVHYFIFYKRSLRHFVPEDDEWLVWVQ